MKDKFIGCLAGSAIGDALGETCYFDTKRDFLKNLIKYDIYPYTDDTAMTISVAEELAQNGTIGENTLGNLFSKSFYDEPARGYGLGTIAVLHSKSLLDGITYPEVARKVSRILYDNDSGSKGNGAPMRVSPVGLFYCDKSDAEIYQAAGESSIPTHLHPIAIDGAAILAKAITMAVSGKITNKLRFVTALIGFAKTQVMKEKMQQVLSSLEMKENDTAAAAHFALNETTEESLPFAVYSFLRHSSSFRNTLFCSILHGGDTDTIGAMACALSGAYLGIGKIPPEWVARLEGAEAIQQLAIRLFNKKYGIRATLPASTGELLLEELEAVENVREKEIRKKYARFEDLPIFDMKRTKKT